METLESIITEHPLLQGLNPRYFHLLKEAAFLERLGTQSQLVEFSQG